MSMRLSSHLCVCPCLKVRASFIFPPSILPLSLPLSQSIARSAACLPTSAFFLCYCTFFFLHAYMCVCVSACVSLSLSLSPSLCGCGCGCGCGCLCVCMFVYRQRGGGEGVREIGRVAATPTLRPQGPCTPARVLAQVARVATPDTRRHTVLLCGRSSPPSTKQQTRRCAAHEQASASLTASIPQ
jgi:hypothetical protein